MRKPVVIRTPYPTVEEIARLHGLSDRVVDELRQMAREFAEETFAKRRHRTPSKAVGKRAVTKRGNARKPAGK
jgi:hypothetical protein